MSTVVKMRSGTCTRLVSSEVIQSMSNSGWAKLILILRERKEPRKSLWSTSISSVTKFWAVEKRRKRRRSRKLKVLSLYYRVVKQFLTPRTRTNLLSKPRSSLNLKSSNRLKLQNLLLKFHFLRTSVLTWSRALPIRRSVSRWWATWSILVWSTHSAMSK